MEKRVSGTRRAEVIPAQRRAIVLEHIRLRGAASIQELADAIGASQSTIRCDLEHLEEKGYLERTHGGALIQRTNHSTFEPEAVIAAQLAKAEKEAIGRQAAASLNPGDSVIFDSGSTVQAAARALVVRNIPITAVTNDLGTGQILASSERVRVVVPGGTVRPGSLTILGEPGQEFLSTIHADVTFVGAHAVADGLLTETSLEIAAIKRAMIGAARRVVLLVDSSKFQPSAFCKICEVALVTEIITDSGADPARLAELREAGVTVTVVDVNGTART